MTEYSTPSLEVHSLICHRDVEIGLICLSSLLSTSNLPIDIVLHDDGSLTEDDIALLIDRLTPDRIIRRDESDQDLKEFLQGYPVLNKARQLLPHMLKVIDVPYYTQGCVVNYVDCDILFLKKHTGLFKLVSEKIDGIFTKDLRNCYGFRLKDHWPLGTVRPIAKLNSGLFSVKKTAIDFPWIEKVCSSCGIEQILQHRSWFEQGVWAAVAGRIRSAIFCPKQIITAEALNSNQEDYVAIHFNGPTRKHLSNFVGRTNLTTPFKSINTISATRRNIFTYFAEAVAFQIRRHTSLNSIILF